MNENLLNRILRDHKRQTRSLALILCLSMLVSLGTFAGFHKTAVAKVYTNEILDCPYTHEGAEPVAHTHNDDCYDGETLVCTLPELEAHTHSDECFAEHEVLRCTLEENPGHQHTEACYSEREELRCGLVENPGHQHGQNCYNADGALICTIPEGEGAHTHTPECYETVRKLTCTVPEGEGAHTHTPECYETVRELICDKPELPVHVHGPECFRTEEVTAGEEEITLPEMPLGDPNADLETASDWERDFEDLELSGNWAADLVLVAATQQGHGESPNNFEVVLNDAGDAWVRHGYTRYGAWYGAPYAEEWSAMFVSFCLRYAGIPAENVPNNPTAAFMAESFSKGELFAGRDYVPAVGDLIFFDTVDDEITNIDHMGIVYYVDEENGTINAVEGDRTDAVATFGYHLDDEEIVGYGILPQNPNYIPNEEDNTDNPDEAFDGFIFMTTDEEEERQEETTTAEEAPVPEVPMPAQSWERTAGGIKVSVEAPEGAFPENTRIAVTPVNGSSLKDTVSDAVSGEVLEVQAVDITFFDASGREIEPAVPIRVVMTPAATEHAEEKTSVVHVDVAQQTAELVEQAVGTEFDNSEVVFDADAFTIYAIVYTYQVEYEYEVDGKTFTSSMPGAENMTLTQIVEGLGIVGEEELETFVSKIQSIASSNEEVAIVTENNEIRVLKDGEAKIVITMQDGAKFHIDVRAEGETSTSNETATVSTVGELYLPGDAELKAEVLDEVKSESAIAAVQAAEETAESTVAAETAYQVFDISLENVEAKDYEEGFRVELNLPENLLGRDFRLYHVHDNQVDELELDKDAIEQADGSELVLSVSFVTPSFSEFVLSYTVDFHYDDEEVSIEGATQVLLSTLIKQLGIKDENGEFIDVANVASVSFSDERLVTVKQVSGEVEVNGKTVNVGEKDFLLTSKEPFTSNEQLTLTMIDGGIVVVNVTDAQESSDLKQFLTDLTVKGATVNDAGNYVVRPGTNYEVCLDFSETKTLQFANTQNLTYKLPEGITIPQAVGTDITINISSHGQTYPVAARVDVDTAGNMVVKFKETDPNYSKLAVSTNVSFRVKVNVLFDELIDSKPWSQTLNKKVEIDTTDYSDAFAQKSAVFDEKTGTYHFTIKVRATNGKPQNVHVKDEISGTALIFNDDVAITGNSKTPTPVANSTVTKGFDYIFSEMNEGEEITITYSATLDPEMVKDGKITYDKTKNTVTVQKEGGEPHTAEYSHTLDLKKPDKANGDFEGLTENGDRLYNWTIEYNKTTLIPAAGDVIKDYIATDAQAYMKYHDDVTVKVYDKDGNLVDTRSFTPGSDHAWTYTVPDRDKQPYRYVFSYQTIVDMGAVNQHGQSVQLINTSEGPGGDTDTGTVDVGTTNAPATITKSVEKSSTTEIKWVSVVHVPESGLNTAVVTDTLPHQWCFDTNRYDSYKDGTLTIDGLLAGESYTVDTSDTTKVVITFYKDAGKQQSGLQAISGGHDITIRLTTKVNQEWLHNGFEKTRPGYFPDMASHKNEIDINGQQKAEATVVFAEPSIKKSGTVSGKGLYMYSVVVSGVSEEPLVITDQFDTSLLQIDTTGYWNNLKIFGGNQYSQDYGQYPVSYADSSDGIVLTANSLPKQANGEFYPYYKITYFLKLREGVNLKELAVQNGGQFDLTNNAIWGDHESSFTFTTKYDFLDKKLLKKPSATDRKATYQITFNPDKGELNEGQPITITDTLSANLSADYTSFNITFDPPVLSSDDWPYVVRGGEGGTTVATFTVPDKTAVTITYDAIVVGNGEQWYENTVVASGETRTVKDVVTINIEGEGDGANAFLQITKVDKFNANKKLAGVKFKLTAAEGKIKRLSDNVELDEVILETDANGILTIDGEQYEIFLRTKANPGGMTYYLEEIEPKPGYKNQHIKYNFTLETDADKVNYVGPQYVYFFTDSFQIQNEPMEGLVVSKVVQSEEAADKTKEYTFTVSILKADGSVDTSVTEEFGEMNFENGVATFTLKDREQKAARGIPQGTRFKVIESDYGELTPHVSINSGTEAASNTVTGQTSGEYTLVTYTNKREEQKGSLKLAKMVTVNDNPVTEANKALTNGVYTFNITGTGANSSISHTVTIEYENGSVKVAKLDDTTVLTADTNGFYEVSDLPEGDYTITELTPTNGTSISKINGIETTEYSTTVKVAAGDTAAAQAYATFTNNINLGSLEITKNIKTNGVIDASKRGTFYFAVYKAADVENGSPKANTTPAATGEIKVTENGPNTVTVSDLPYGTYYVYELTGQNGTPIVSGEKGSLALINDISYTVIGSGTTATVGAAQSAGIEGGNGTGGTPAGYAVTLTNEITEFEFYKKWININQQEIEWDKDIEVTVQRLKSTGAEDDSFSLEYTIKKDKIVNEEEFTPTGATDPKLKLTIITEENTTKYNFKIEGLEKADADGDFTYFVKETNEQLVGYMKPSYENSSAPTGSAAASNGGTIINKQEGGFELPQTGGIGTALFTALGGLMTVTAGAILTMRRGKRKTAES